MKPRSERRASPATHRVLVVDDEPDIRELLELTLAKMGLQVDSAGSLGGIGLAILCAGMALLALLPPDPSVPDICWRMALCGWGFGALGRKRGHERQRRRRIEGNHRYPSYSAASTA